MTISLPPINTARLWSRVETLSSMTVPGQPWTRRAFTDLFLEGREWLKAQYQLAGLTISIDAGGNLVGRREGKRTDARPIICGSHSDTVLSGGRYDGIIGVLAAIEIAHTFAEHGIELEHPFEVIDFLSEEPSDYGVSCIGSRAFAGELTPTMLAERNAAGETLAEGIRRMGGNPDVLNVAIRNASSTAAFVELHIEQGPVLESHALSIGVVTNIVGIRRHRLIIDGRADHAGTTPMTVRSDALVGAARIIDAVSRHAHSLSSQGNYVVATVGRLVLTPNASNAVPGRVEMMLEVRSDALSAMDGFAEKIVHDAANDMTELRLTLSASEVSRALPTDCADTLIETIEASAKYLGYGAMRLPSGAGHDAAYVAKTGPAGMIFIPCLGGRSHTPEESIQQTHLAEGVNVMYETIMRLDSMGHRLG